MCVVRIGSLFKHKTCIRSHREIGDKILLAVLLGLVTKVGEAVTIHCLTFIDPLGLHVLMYKFLFLLFSHLNRASWSTIRNKLSQAKPSPAAQARGTVTGQPHTWRQVGLSSGLFFFFLWSPPTPSQGGVRMSALGFPTLHLLSNRYPPSQPHPRAWHNFQSCLTSGDSKEATWTLALLPWALLIWGGKPQTRMDCCPLKLSRICTYFFPLLLKIWAVKQKLDLKKLSIFAGVGAAGEPSSTVTRSAYLPSGSVTCVQFSWMLSALRCP